ncbi:MAG TPA: FHA domain-containing protein [Gemmataceae bacterium]|nr:FHA domain-containing protein [Gemmataceae bacterium]
MKLSLVVLTPGPNQGKVLEIKLSQFVIGRDPQCHLRPSSPMISKRHCALLQREDKAFVRDFDSTNGTFVNNAPVKGEVEVHNGDQLKLGPLLFTVVVEAGTPVNRPTPPPPTKAATQTARPVKAATPPPAGKPAAATVGAATPNPSESVAATAEKSDPSSSDDDIAAMLLSLHDDTSPGLAGRPPEVPEGSTVHEMPLPPEVAAQMAENDKDKAPPTKPVAPANTSQAAKSILEKYMKRPRA